ncbi:MAG: GNAT family N-acetyltransferase [Cyanobacteria bacterium REEB67]|nr:GNAT family N-acetyltransferase [Cyanobacteria bacterium REEB67]
MLIKEMTRADLLTAIEWAAAEGWNPGKNDIDSFYDTDREGFLGGFLDGRMIASISAVRYSGDFGFIGFYIVVPEERGKGYGYTLWQAAMARLGKGNIGLDGVPAQVINYERSGFRSAYKTSRYGHPSWQQAEACEPSRSVSDLSATNMDKVINYDKNFVPAPRPTLIKNWLRQKESIARVLLDKDEVKGYGVIRPSRDGYKIGPLFAEDEEAAEAIFQALVSNVCGQAVYIDVPGPNEAGLTLATKHGMQPMFECMRMYTQGEPTLPIGKIYGSTSFELG